MNGDGHKVYQQTVEGLGGEGNYRNNLGTVSVRA